MNILGMLILKLNNKFKKLYSEDVDMAGKQVCRNSK